MAPELPKVPIGVLIVFLTLLGTACGWAPGVWSGSVGPEPPATARADLTGVAVATLDAPVKARRGGRVLALQVQPGDAVSEGDALIEFEDLALERSKAELRQEIALLSAAQDAADAPAASARSARRDLRIAALRHLEETHKLASEDFERWTELFEEGLVARLDFEEKRQEFDALRERLREAKALASQETPAEEPPESAELRRSRRLLERLHELPKTYLLVSPWEGMVKELSIAVGDVPERGAAVATVSRAALLMLEVQTAQGSTVLGIEEACGVPGPLVFAQRDGKLLLAAPSPHLRPGDECMVRVALRE